MPGVASDICTKSAATRKKMYRKSAVKRMRAQACGSDKMPRCVGGRSYCASKPGRSKSPKRKRSKKVLYLR
jgi:hypothetical protein